MIEWALLVALVPLILVPIVLLFGFAGCGSFDSDSPPPPLPQPPDPPSDLSATAVSDTEVALTWSHAAMGGVTYVVSILGPDGLWNDNHGNVTGKEFTSKNLTPATVYFYRVRATANGLESDKSNLASARTWQWQTAHERALTTSDAPFAGDCLVQRFDRTILTYTGTVKRIRLTLRGSANAANNPVSIAQVSISHQAQPGLIGNPNPDDQDSEPPLVLLGSHSLPGSGNPVTLPAVDFALATTKDLLVVFDIAQGSLSQTRRVGAGVGASECYTNDTLTQAAQENRDPTGWQTRAGVFLVEKIEVLTAS